MFSLFYKNFMEEYRKFIVSHIKRVYEEKNVGYPPCSVQKYSKFRKTRTHMGHHRSHIIKQTK
jgi:hypothetical protein